MRAVTKRVCALIAAALTSAAHADSLGVVVHVEESLTAQARVALVSAGTPHGASAIVIRGYLVTDGPGGAMTNSAEFGVFELFPRQLAVHFYQDRSGTAFPPTAAAVASSSTVQFDSYVTLGAETREALNNATLTSFSDEALRLSGEVLDGVGDPTIAPSDIDFGDGTWGLLLFQVTLLGQCPDSLPASGDFPIDQALIGSIAVVGFDVNEQFGFGPISNGCLGELDENVDAVSGGDLATLLAGWGLTDPCATRADLNVDGVVNGADLAILLANWGCEP